MSSNSQILQQKLDELAAAQGFVVFAIGEYYVQFAKENPDSPMMFEAASHHFVEAVSPDLERRFREMNFQIEAENYHKEIPNSNFAATAREVEQIFGDIYGVDYSQQFELTEDIY